ncbi:MAG: AzlC family ABC transporter permease [Dehalococcoidaceae bacterium]|nr:AzlC family ABC transporter permease [Dehalococcoidaceae bacterium]
MKHQPVETSHRVKTGIYQGVAAAWPVCLGYVPIGLAFGVIAQKAGLQPWQIGLMSLVVFAGSAQFIAVSMLSGGAGAVSVILTTFVVNLRHFLMSSSLAIYMGGTRKWLLSLFAYGITDESFALNLSRFKQGNWGIAQALTVNHVSNFFWIAGTLAGGFAGEFIPDGVFGIDYALPAMFIGLLVMQLKGRRYIITAILAGILAVLFAMILPGNFYIIAASMLAAFGGVLISRRRKPEHGGE